MFGPKNNHNNVSQLNFILTLLARAEFVHLYHLGFTIFLSLVSPTFISATNSDTDYTSSLNVNNNNNNNIGYEDILFHNTAASPCLRVTSYLHAWKILMFTLFTLSILFSFHSPNGNYAIFT